VFTFLTSKIEVHDVKVISYSGIILRNGVKHHFIKVAKAKIRRVLAINNYVKQLKPDIVLVAGLVFPFHLLSLRLILSPSIKIFVQHHAERPLRGPKAWVQRIADNYISGYFFTSKGIAAEWINRRMINASKITEVMEASSVITCITGNEAIALTQVKEGSYLWVGGLHARKDPVTLVKGFASFCKTRPGKKLYMVYGSDELLPEVRRLIKEYNLNSNIHLVGKVPHDQMTYWYNSVDFIISTSHHEGSGVAICEAMSCGCIPVLTNIPSFQMMTNNGKCGLLFDVGDSDSLAKALDMTLQIDKEKFKALVFKHYDTKLSFPAIARDMGKAFGIL